MRSLFNWIEFKSSASNTASIRSISSDRHDPLRIHRLELQFDRLDLFELGDHTFLALVEE